MTTPWTIDSGVVTIDSEQYTIDGGGPSSQPTIRVTATAVGQYGGVTRNIGDVFDIRMGALANEDTNYLPGIEGGPFFGWMLQVSPNAPLLANPPARLTVANYPRLVY